MKKFLFTLAALFMAGAAFANDYWYIPNFDITEDMCGTDVEIPVAAHFDAYVSAGQFTINLPEGFEIVDYIEGEDATIDYFTSTGRARTVTAGYTTTDNKEFIVITSATVQGYYQVDGAWVSYGAVKWEPGDYDEMLLITVSIPADFDCSQKNVPISIYSQPSSGQDPRGPISNGETSTNENYINYEEVVPTTPFVGTADVTFTENVAALSYTSNDPNANVVVTVNGEEVEVEWNNGEATWTAPVYTTPGTYRYEVTLTVTPTGNYVGEPASDTDVFEYTILETTATPEIIIVDQNAHHCYFTVEGDGVITVLVDGEPAETVEVDLDGDGVMETYYVLYASTEGEENYVITATAKEENKYESLPDTENVHFDQWDAVNELVNGKTIANVRYYNMAGQEMQSVNGMTIKVTTYTDGTTSAVKVMK